MKKTGSTGGFRGLLPVSLGLGVGYAHREPAWPGDVLGSLGRSPSHCARTGEPAPATLLPPAPTSSPCSPLSAILSVLSGLARWQIKD